MRNLFCCFSVWLLFYGAWAAVKTDKPTRNVIVTAEEEKIRDAAGYQAIADIHREMDDDHSGSIDRKETTGFMMEDMQMRGSDRLRREHAFHGDDDAITVDDLWEAWFESEERAWTQDQVLHWIVTIVNLPMYAERITKLKLDGTVLPRLAAHNSTFITTHLGIKSSVHRQKLRLNALDVVLFGLRDTNSKSKDIALALLLLILTSVLILYARQRRRARQQVTELSQRLTQLKSMECEFEDVQKKWNEDRSRRSVNEGSQIEMENLRIQLEQAERRLEQNGGSSGAPLSLQPLLRKTCENEMSFLEKQRQDCVNEMKDAIEMVDRLQKKQGSVLSSLKLATGASSASDQVDSKIFALKSRMEKIHALTRETQERWNHIESLCGFPLIYLQHEMTMSSPLHESLSSSHFYASPTGSCSNSAKSIPIGSIPSSAIPPQKPNTLALKSNTSGAPSSIASTSSHKTVASSTPTVVQQRIPTVQSPPNGGDVVGMFHLDHGHGASSGSLTNGMSDDSDSLVSPDRKKKGFRDGIKKIFQKSSSKGSLGSN